MTEEQMREEVIGVLHDWLQGYSSPDSLGRQWRMQVIDSNTWGATVQLVDHSGDDRPSKVYRINVRAIESW